MKKNEVIETREEKLARAQRLVNSEDFYRWQKGMDLFEEIEREDKENE